MVARSDMAAANIEMFRLAELCKLGLYMNSTNTIAVKHKSHSCAYVWQQGMASASSSMLTHINRRPATP